MGQVQRPGSWHPASTHDIVLPDCTSTPRSTLKDNYLEPHIPSPKHFSLDVKVGSVAPGPTSKVVIQRCTCLGLLKYALKPRLGTLQMKSEQIYLRLQSKGNVHFCPFVF